MFLKLQYSTQIVILKCCNYLEPRPVPTSCEKPGDNQVIVSMDTDDSCFQARNCCGELSIIADLL